MATFEEIRQRGLERRQQVLGEYLLWLIGLAMVSVATITLVVLGFISVWSLLVLMILVYAAVVWGFWRGMETLSAIHQETMRELDSPRDH